MCGMLSSLLGGGTCIYTDICIFGLYFRNTVMVEKHRLTTWKVELSE